MPSKSWSRRICEIVISNQKQKLVKKKNHLVGFAIDLSGSMQSSMKNRTGSYINRFDSIKDSLDELFEKAKRESELQKKRKKDKTSDIYFYAYGFGLKSREYCDLLTLLTKATINSSYTSRDVEIYVNKFQKFRYPFEELEKIAKRHDKRGWGHRCSRVFNEDDAQILANVLNQNPEKARELCEELPNNMFDAGLDIGWSKFTFSESSLERVEREAKEVIRKIRSGIEKFEQEIRNLDDYSTLLLEEVYDKIFNRSRTAFNEIERFIYGSTPMVSTLHEIKKRIKIEESRVNRFDKKIIFIISDGEPTDGDPSRIFEELKRDDVIIISCLITDKDIARPKRLYNSYESNWNEGAKLLFMNASRINSNSDFEGYLVSRGWEIPSQSKLFIQVNHSEVLKEFTDLVFSLIE